MESKRRPGVFGGTRGRSGLVSLLRMSRVAGSSSKRCSRKLLWLHVGAAEEGFSCDGRREQQEQMGERVAADRSICLFHRICIGVQRVFLSAPPELLRS